MNSVRLLGKLTYDLCSCRQPRMMQLHAEPDHLQQQQHRLLRTTSQQVQCTAGSCHCCAMLCCVMPEFVVQLVVVRAALASHALSLPDARRIWPALMDPTGIQLMTAVPVQHSRPPTLMQGLKCKPWIQH